MVWLNHSVVKGLEAVLKNLLFIISVLMLSACVTKPESVKPVTGFELNRYLGKWYEIARLDHSFEREMSEVTAEYSLRKDGGVRVLNRGYLESDSKWKQAEGKACFMNGESEAYLKVSFFGPFYGSYVVFELDHQGYQYAFVSGPSAKYLWLLSRSPTVTSEVMDKFIKMSKERGFDTDKLIYVRQK